METETINNQKKSSSNELVETILSGEGIYFKCGQVAKILGIKPDSVRYYTETFSEFLHPEKTKNDKGGHRLYTDEDIVTLRTILTLLKKYSPAEVRAQLRDPNLRIILASDEDADSEEKKSLLAHNEFLVNQLITSLCSVFSQSLEQQSNMFNDKFLLQQQELEQLKVQNQALAKQLEHTNELLCSIDENTKRSKGGFFSKFRK